MGSRTCRAADLAEGMHAWDDGLGCQTTITRVEADGSDVRVWLASSGGPYLFGSEDTVLMADDPAAASPPSESSPVTNGGTMTTTENAGETYTHRAWLDWAETCMTQLGTLQNALDAMCAQIAADDGDQAQADAIREWQSAIEGVQAEGRRMVDGVNAVQLPVGEAVAAAGGPANTPHAEYADEARSA
jgi:hypothetical protein